MAGMIPRQFIDDLLARADIVELIDGRVPLKKAGKNYQACCPFHTEKSPSFTLVEGSILHEDLDKRFEQESYSVIANIPYHITSPIIRKLLS